MTDPSSPGPARGQRVTTAGWGRFRESVAAAARGLLADHSGALGDFTTSARVIPISVLAVGIGILASFAAWTLLRLIAFFTNLFFYQRWSAAIVSPAGNALGPWVVVVPVVGALVIGF